MVGLVRFELTTSCSPSTRAGQPALQPVEDLRRCLHQGGRSHPRRATARLQLFEAGHALRPAKSAALHRIADRLHWRGTGDYLKIEGPPPRPRRRSSQALPRQNPSNAVIGCPLVVRRRRVELGAEGRVERRRRSTKKANLTKISCNSLI
jgi:hypothetical protein